MKWKSFAAVLFASVLASPACCSAHAAPKDLTLAEIIRVQPLEQVVRTVGTVEDIYQDDVDPRYWMMCLKDGDETVLATVPIEGLDTPDSFSGRRLRITGLCTNKERTERRLPWLRIHLASVAAVEMLEPSTGDIFDYPPLRDVFDTDPRQLLILPRRTATGAVVACWRGNRILLMTDHHTHMRIELADGVKPPPVGTRIQASGFAETDLFRVNLSRARIRTLAAEPTRLSAAVETNGIEKLFFCTNGRRAYDVRALGNLFHIIGRIRSLPLSDIDGARIEIDCEGITLMVDATSCPQVLGSLAVGCKISLGGICVHDTENWSPHHPLPRITGLSLALRSPHDLIVLSMPSWWTPARLVFVIGTLAAILFAILFWNLSLRRLAERRGRDLSEQTVARVEADLKVRERTRLAVELHDSLSQTLTGIAMELRAVEQLSDNQPELSKAHLQRAGRVLSSCRRELKNCLWDLRNDALDAADMDTAIRQTLAPHIGDAELSIRFSIQRERMTDNTAHTLLRILRELAVNAVRHGHATVLRIAGAIENDLLRVSLRDNGCGFNCSAAPGMAEGHFGLQGIQERVDALSGSFDIISRAEQGTKAVISIPIRQEKT